MEKIVIDLIGPKKPPIRDSSTKRSNSSKHTQSSKPTTIPQIPKPQMKKPIGNTSKPLTSNKPQKSSSSTVINPKKPVEPEIVKKLPPISSLTIVLDHANDIGPCMRDRSKTAAGVIAMCSLPGKVEKEKDKADKDKMNKELLRLHENKIKNVVCLLNKYEMRAFGVDKEKYIAACANYGINPIFYEIVEMAPPDKDPKIFHGILIQVLHDLIMSGDSMAVHCRAGVGRAGLVVACLLLSLGYFKTSDEVIKHLRGVRHHNCVESHSQRRYVKQYQVYMESLKP